MTIRKTIAGIACAATLFAAATASTAQDSGAVSELHALNDRFNEAIAAHDAKGVLDLYAEDTIWIEQGKPVVKGLEEPRKLFEFVAANKGEVTHSVDTLFVSDDGTLAVMIGSVDAKMESVGLDATGTYLYVLKPSDNGWKVVTDMWHQHAAQE